MDLESSSIEEDEFSRLKPRLLSSRQHVDTGQTPYLPSSYAYVGVDGHHKGFHKLQGKPIQCNPESIQVALNFQLQLFQFSGTKG